MSIEQQDTLLTILITKIGELRSVASDDVIDWINITLELMSHRSTEGASATTTTACTTSDSSKSPLPPDHHHNRVILQLQKAEGYILQEKHTAALDIVNSLSSQLLSRISTTIIDTSYNTENIQTQGMGMCVVLFLATLCTSNIPQAVVAMNKFLTQCVATQRISILNGIEIYPMVLSAYYSTIRKRPTLKMDHTEDINNPKLETALFKEWLQYYKYHEYWKHDAPNNTTNHQNHTHKSSLGSYFAVVDMVLMQFCTEHFPQANSNGKTTSNQSRTQSNKACDGDNTVASSDPEPDKMDVDTQLGSTTEKEGDTQPLLKRKREHDAEEGDSSTSQHTGTSPSTCNSSTLRSEVCEIVATIPTILGLLTTQRARDITTDIPNIHENSFHKLGSAEALDEVINRCWNICVCITQNLLPPSDDPRVKPSSLPISSNLTTEYHGGKHSVLMTPPPQGQAHAQNDDICSMTSFVPRRVTSGLLEEPMTLETSEMLLVAAVLFELTYDLMIIAKTQDRNENMIATCLLYATLLRIEAEKIHSQSSTTERSSDIHPNTHSLHNPTKPQQNLELILNTLLTKKNQQDTSIIKFALVLEFILVCKGMHHNPPSTLNDANHSPPSLTCISQYSRNKIDLYTQLFSTVEMITLAKICETEKYGNVDTMRLIYTTALASSQEKLTYNEAEYTHVCDLFHHCITLSRSREEVSKDFQ